MSRTTATPPRGMTMADLVALIGGIAVALAWPTSPPIPPGWSSIVERDRLVWGVWYIGRCLLALNFGAAVALVARVVRYGVMPRPAEWLVILLCFVSTGFDIEKSFIDDWILPLAAFLGDPTSTRALTPDGGWNRPRNLPRPLAELEGWSLVWGGVALAVGVIAFLTMLRKRAIPSIIKTLLLAIAAGALLRVTLPILNRIIPWNLQDWHPRSRPSWISVMVWELILASCLIPAGVIFSIPILAALRDRRRPEHRGWNWMERLGMTIAAIFVTHRALDFLPGKLLKDILPGPPTSPIWRASYGLQGFNHDEIPFWGFLEYVVVTRIFMALWAVVVLLLGLLIVTDLGPAWNRLLGLGYDGPGSESPQPEA